MTAALDRESPESLRELEPWGPGLEFWLGFMINDNDQPGSDVQNDVVWPATYGNFNPREDGGRANLE